MLKELHSKNQPPTAALFRAFLEAAKKEGSEGDESRKAAEWLVENVEARVVSASSRTVDDPYSDDAAQTLVVSASEWKSGAKVRSGDRIFRLPDPLMPEKIAAVFQAGLHHRPSDGKPGILGNPDGGQAISVDRGNWYPGAEFMEQESGFTVVAPENIQLLAAPVDLELVRRERKPIVISPVTRKPVDLSGWGDWFPGFVVTEMIGDQKRKVGVLGDENAQATQDGIDPRLTCVEARLVREPGGESGKGGIIPVKFRCEAVSPYTSGLVVPVPVDLWRKGGPVSHMVKSSDGKKDLIFTFVLPADEKFAAIPGALVKDGLFAYWKDPAAAKPEQIDLTQKRDSDFSGFEFFEHEGRRFEIANYSKYLISINDDNADIVDHRTGRVLVAKALIDIRKAAVEGSNLKEPAVLSPNAREVAMGGENPVARKIREDKERRETETTQNMTDNGNKKPRSDNPVTTPLGTATQPTVTPPSIDPVPKGKSGSKTQPPGGRKRYPSRINSIMMEWDGSGYVGRLAPSPNPNAARDISIRMNSTDPIPSGWEAVPYGNGVVRVQPKQKKN